MTKRTSLILSKDDKGRVSQVGGEITTPSDQILSDLINDTNKNNVTTIIESTSSNFSKDGTYFIGGGFKGNKRGGDGKIYTRQIVNPDAFGKIDRLHGVPIGTGVLHEVLESYIGGINSPNIGTVTFEDVENRTPSGLAYLNAHNEAMRLDPFFREPFIVGIANINRQLEQITVSITDFGIPQLNIQVVIIDFTNK